MPATSSGVESCTLMVGFELKTRGWAPMSQLYFNADTVRPQTGGRRMHSQIPPPPRSTPPAPARSLVAAHRPVAASDCADSGDGDSGPRDGPAGRADAGARPPARRAAGSAGRRLGGSARRGAPPRRRPAQTRNCQGPHSCGRQYAREIPRHPPPPQSASRPPSPIARIRVTSCPQHCRPRQRGAFDV